MPGLIDYRGTKTAEIKERSSRETLLCPKVPQGQVGILRRAKSSAVTRLGTEGLGPCVGLALWGRERSGWDVGVVAHFDSGSELTAGSVFRWLGTSVLVPQTMWLCNPSMPAILSHLDFEESRYRRWLSFNSSAKIMNCILAANKAICATVYFCELDNIVLDITKGELWGEKNVKWVEHCEDLDLYSAVHPMTNPEDDEEKDGSDKTDSKRRRALSCAVDFPSSAPLSYPGSR